MKTLPGVFTMPSAIPEMACGTNDLFCFLFVLCDAIGYFHDGGRDVPSLLLLSLDFKGKN